LTSNDAADYLAKKGCGTIQKPATQLSYYTTKRIITSQYHKNITNHHLQTSKNKRWEALSTQNVPEYPRKNAAAIFRQFTGHDCLAKHHHRIGISPSPLCKQQQYSDMGSNSYYLVEFLSRIVYSKMLIRTGMKSGGGSGQFRRSLVLRFLAGCHENEMITFAEMAFKIYAQMIQDNPVAMVDSILNELDLQHIIPPKRLQSSLNLLNVIMDKFGRLMGQKILPYLLRVLFCISAIIFGSLTQREIIHPGYLPILLRLRNSCQEISAKFFEHFDNYIWSNAEVDTVFRILVWPCLEKLPVEGIHSPTALLKLFLVWSRHPRYFVLLAKHAEGKKNIAPLPCIMDLLLRTQTHPSVTTAIMELVENLLTLQDYQEDWTESSEVTPKIPVSLLAGVDKESVRELSLCEDLNYGSCLLIPHIPAILERLERKIVSLKHRSLSQRDLVVLSRATELVWDAPTSDTLLRLLLPVLEKKAGSGEDIVSHIISTLNNLLKNIIHPEKHLRSLGYGTTSFDGEIIAISESLRNLLCHINKFKNAVILSDSKAAILSIVSKHTPSSQTAEITKMLSQLISLNKRIVFQWIPSHCGILGNENVDALAKKGSIAT
ncbi:hypothetical protein ANN_17704, partial [Periplaneta americana]